MTSPPATTRHGFKPAQKLRNAGAFEQARKTGRRIGDDLFGIQYVANNRGHARLGMAVALRTAGSAVRRNRIRRVIRESFRLRQDALPPADFVVSARPRARDAGNTEMFDSLDRLWDKIRIS